MDTGELIRTLKGLAKEEGMKLCKDNGYETRVVREDSNNFMITTDLRFYRVNLYLDNNTITKVNIG
jgi:hypothetical protein